MYTSGNCMWTVDVITSPRTRPVLLLAGVWFIRPIPRVPLNIMYLSMNIIIMPCLLSVLSARLFVIVSVCWTWCRCICLLDLTSLCSCLLDLTSLYLSVLLDLTSLYTFCQIVHSVLSCPVCFFKHLFWTFVPWPKYIRAHAVIVSFFFFFFFYSFFFLLCSFSSSFVVSSSHSGSGKVSKLVLVSL